MSEMADLTGGEAQGEPGRPVYMGRRGEEEEGLLSMQRCAKLRHRGGGRREMARTAFPRSDASGCDITPQQCQRSTMLSPNPLTILFTLALKATHPAMYTDADAYSTPPGRRTSNSPEISARTIS